MLLVAPGLLLVAVGVEMMIVPADQLRDRWIGTNSLVCMTFIPLIGIGPLAAFLFALRHGAPTQPSLAGAVAGLVAGGLAATFYAAHCTDALAALRRDLVSACHRLACPGRRDRRPSFRALVGERHC